MKKHNISVFAVTFAGALTSMGAMAVSGVGSINHDISFGGVISERAPKWVWNLPQNTVTIDLKETDGVVDTQTSTKVWNIMPDNQQYKFLEGYMEPTINGLALQGLNADVKYLQNGIEVKPTYSDANHATLLSLKATGKKASGAVDGNLALTLQPVLLLAQAENTSDKTIIAKQLADAGVTQADVNAIQAYNNAKIQLESQQGKVGATTVTYNTKSLWPAESLADGTVMLNPMIGGYASTMTAGKLSFPKDTAVRSWESVITVQVQYK